MSNSQLYQPNRQSVKGLVVLILIGLQGAIRSFWPLIAIYVIKNEELSEKRDLFLSVLVVLFVLLIVHAVLFYLHFYFYIEGSKFILKKGYLNKKTLSISFERIQNINTRQNLIQQFLNVYTLEVDTAGSVKKELKIHAISKALADELKHVIEEGRKELVETDFSVSDKSVDLPAQKILSLSMFDLLKIGISNNHFKTALLILAFGMQLFQDIKDLFKTEAEKYSNELLTYVSDSGWLIVTGLLVFFLFISVLFSMFQTFLKYFDLNLSKKAKAYKLTSGLLNKKDVLIPHKKVQDLRWETNPLRKVFGIYKLQIGQVASAALKESQKVDVPGCLQSHLTLIRSDFFSDSLVENEEKLLPNRVYLWRYWFIIGWLVLLPFVFFYYRQALFWIFVPVYLAIVFFLSLRAFKRKYMQVNEDQLLVSSGMFGQEWFQAKLYKLQAVKFKQSVFQKRKGLASVHMYTASGKETIPFIDAGLAYKLYTFLLYKIEVSKEEWM